MHDFEEGMDEFDEDAALEDEDFEEPKRTVNQSGVRGGKIDVAPEDSIAPADRDGEADEDAAQTGMSYPLSLLITVQKPGDEAIVVKAVARDGTIATEQINYYPKSSLIAPRSPQDTAESVSLYSGPPFENLDTDLQLMFENYLEERGVNAELANILPHFVEWKEQREYVDWLQSMFLSRVLVRPD
jgi:complement component 1 Q subcomponent-binding protein, mitochondrial